MLFGGQALLPDSLPVINKMAKSSELTNPLFRIRYRKIIRQIGLFLLLIFSHLNT